MDERFPDEINSEIFSRLSVKSLLRVRSSCRDMRDFTHNPIFVDTHLKFSSQRRNPNLILTDNKCREGNNLNNNLSSLYVVQNEETTNHYSCNKVSLEIPDFKEFRLAGSCNGLICLVHPTKKYEIHVCNPCTGKYIKIPPPVSIGDRPLDIVVGFGVIPKTNKYKVVVIVDSPEHGDFDHLLQKVFVYTLGDTNWILLESNGFVLRLRSPNCKAVVNGALHWVSDANLIVSFNLETEEFIAIPRPELELGRGSFYLRVFDGKLMILNTSFRDRIEMWVMNDYGVVESWTRTFTVYEQDIGRNILNARIECFLENGDVLMVYDHQALLRYNLRSALVSELIIDGLPKRFHAIAHVGTLLSPLLKIDEQIDLDEKDLDE